MLKKCRIALYTRVFLQYLLSLQLLDMVRPLERPPLERPWNEIFLQQLILVRPRKHFAATYLGATPEAFRLGL